MEEKTNNNENELLKAIKEEYEKKLLIKENEIQSIKTDFENQIKNINENHIKQIRAIISGSTERNLINSEDDEQDLEETEFDTVVKSAKSALKKLI